MVHDHYYYDFYFLVFRWTFQEKADLPYYAGSMKLHASSGQVSKGRIIGLDEVIYRTGASKSKIYRDIKSGKFPPQAKKPEGSTSAGWYEKHIDDFVEARRPEWNQGETQSDRNVQQNDVSVRQIESSADTKFHVPAVSLKRIEEKQTLVQTGLNLDGRDVYCHVPSRKLLIVVGSISEELQAALASVACEDSGRDAANRDCA